MKDFFLLLVHRKFWFHVLGAILGFALLIMLLMVGINVYTRHGQALSVPDFTGMSILDANKSAGEKQLHAVIVDSAFVKGQQPGTILAQNPSPGTKVKINRTIFLTINAINPEKIPMPNVVGVSVRQAEAILQTYGLHVGLRRYIPDVAKDYVLQQQIQDKIILPGDRVAKGSEIDLILGLGLGDEKVITPDIKRLTKNEAIEILSSNYLNLGAIIYDNSMETLQDSVKAVIWKQSPEYGKTLKAGSAIDIWLTTEKSPEESTTAIE